MAPTSETEPLNIEIRNAGPADHAVISRFNTDMAVETEGRALDPGLVGPGVSALLADHRKGRYWLAAVDGTTAGQIMVTYEWSDWRNGMLCWIQSVYIAPDYRRMGVFTALDKHVESLARADQEVCGIRLYVEGSNERAQQTYRSLCMTSPNYLVMESIFSD